MDKELRDLERAAAHGDPHALQALIRALLRHERFVDPVIGRRTEDIDLPSHPVTFLDILRYIPENHRFTYFQLARFLLSNGIPFRLTASGSCNCENMACVSYPPEPGHHPLLRCFRCKQAFRIFRRDNRLFRRCVNPECEDVIFARREGFDEASELYPGPCSNFAWRAYSNPVGSLCDVCITRMPEYEHGTRCNCVQCGTAIGPYFEFRSRIVTSERLAALLSSYKKTINDTKNLTVAFNADLNISEVEESRRVQEYGPEDSLPVRWAQSPSQYQKRLDGLQTNVVEVLPNGQYRLRTVDHLNYQLLQNRFRDMLETLEKEAVSKSTLREAAELFRLHLVGKDLDLNELSHHVLQTTPPNMEQLVNQVVTLLQPFGCQFNQVEIASIDPLSLRAEFSMEIIGNPPARTITISREYSRDVIHFSPSQYHLVLINGRPYSPYAETDRPPLDIPEFLERL